MPRPKKKPDYDNEKIMNEFMDAICEFYGDSGKTMTSHRTLSEVAGEFSISTVKVRKILITRGLYSTAQSRLISELYKYNTIDEICSIMNLNHAAISCYLPYERTVYKLSEVSTAVERTRTYRERVARCRVLCEKIRGEKMDCEKPVTELLWDAIVALQSYPFQTTKSLKYSYTVKGGEIFVDRKKKSITRSSVEVMFQRVMEIGMEYEIGGVRSVDGRIIGSAGGGIDNMSVNELFSISIPVTVSGPKKLGGFGASYIYPVFVRFGLIVPP